jgi:predicted Rossmann fold flavoprotein
MNDRAVEDRVTEPGHDVIVIGAGAAGLCAALFAARGGARVALVETRPKPGAKIRVSGGGRCNVLPSQVSLDNFHTSGSQHAMRNILFSWPLDSVRAFFETDLGIPLVTEPTGKVFPQSSRSLDVVEAMLAACARAGVELVCGFRVTALERPAGRSNASDLATFRVTAADGRSFQAPRIVLATGGLSLPKSGSDGGGLQMARGLGIAAEPTYPALVPLATDDARWTVLTGLAVHACLRAKRGDRVLEEREGDLLFTHRGFSGPVVLDMSRHLTAPGTEGVRLCARWGKVRDWEPVLRAARKRLVSTVLHEFLPERFITALLELAGVSRDRREHELTRDERRRLLAVLMDCRLPVTGSEGYATAEVTCGGLALAEVSPRTLECRTVPALYACGEILDVVGDLGGYNFLWAWVSGRKAGEAAAAAAAATASR